MTEFVKFPSTPHLAWLSTAQFRKDKVLSPTEVDAILTSDVTVEEKLDGANIGFGVAGSGELAIQNRGTILGPNSHAQFAPLWNWLATRRADLTAALGSRLVLFGEWCFARHSCYYDRLPDWFLAFDVYDHDELAFWSVVRRDGLCEKLGLHRVPRIASGRFSQQQLVRLLERQSAFGPERVEGLYVRADQGPHLRARAKLVRPEFTQSIGAHWKSRRLELNRLERS